MPQEIRIDTPQGRLFARCWGERGAQAPIVLFHDSLGCVALWRDFPARLSQASGRQVIAYDRLGFGRSDPHPGLLDRHFVQEEAGQVFPLLCGQLGIEHFIAFGHSVGGAMAVSCAARFPARCQGLVTESAQAFVEERTLAGIRHARQAFADEAQFDRLRKYHGDKAQWVLDAWVDTWLAPDFLHWNLDEELPRVHCPVLAIHGEHDEYGSLRHPERIRTLSTGPAAAEIVPACGHVPHREQENVVIEAVGRFLGPLAAQDDKVALV